MKKKYNVSEIILLILSIILLTLGILTIILLLTTTNKINENKELENNIVENG